MLAWLATEICLFSLSHFKTLILYFIPPQKLKFGIYAVRNDSLMISICHLINDECKQVTVCNICIVGTHLTTLSNENNYLGITLASN